MLLRLSCGDYISRDHALLKVRLIKKVCRLIFDAVVILGLDFIVPLIGIAGGVTYFTDAVL